MCLAEYYRAKMVMRHLFQGVALHGVRRLVSLRVIGTAVVASPILFSAACESAVTSPVAPSPPDSASVATAVGTSHDTKTPAMEVLTGSWRGLYSWDCGNGLVGTATATFGFDSATSPGLYSGYASYLRGRTVTTVQRFVGDINDPENWSRNPAGSIVKIEVPGSPGNFANNEFTGRLNGSQIVGTTLNGDTVAFPGVTGCSALTGPSGTFAIDKL